MTGKAEHPCPHLSPLVLDVLREVDQANDGRALLVSQRVQQLDEPVDVAAAEKSDLPGDRLVREDLREPVCGLAYVQNVVHLVRLSFGMFLSQFGAGDVGTAADDSVDHEIVCAAHSYLQFGSGHLPRPDSSFCLAGKESRIGGIRAWRNLWAEKFLCERSECGLRKFSEPQAGEAARGFARTAVDQGRMASKSTRNDVLQQSGAKRSILLGDTEGGQHRTAGTVTLNGCHLPTVRTFGTMIRDASVAAGIGV